MKASQCEQCIPWLSAYMPKVVAGIIGLIVAIICLILYFVRERQRHKNFYGKEDKLSFREEDDPRKNLEMDVAAFGGCPDELVATMAGDSQTPERGVKVMVLKKVRVPNKTPSMPMHKQITPQQIRPESPYQLFLQVLSDKTGRAQELLDVIKTYPVPVGSRTKVANTIVESVYDILEKMTRKHFVVFGMMDKGRSVVCGQEHMAENVEEMSLQVRLQLVKPFSLNISAYQVEVSSVTPAVAAAQVPPPAAVLEGKEPPPGKITEREGNSKIATDVTPMMTPMIPSVRKSDRPPILLAETPVSANRPHASKSKMSSSALINAIRNMSKDRKEVDSHALVPPPSSPGKEGDKVVVPRTKESKPSSGRPGIHVKLPPQPKSRKEASKPPSSKVSPQPRLTEGVERPGSKNMTLAHHDSNHATDRKLSDTHRSSEHARTPFKEKQERHESKVQKSRSSGYEKLKNEKSRVRESPKDHPKEKGKSKQSAVLANGMPSEMAQDKVRSRNSGRVPDTKQKEKSPPPEKITL